MTSLPPLDPYAIIFGLLTGFFVGGAGYLKSVPLQKFNPTQFLGTMVTAAIASSVSVMTGFSDTDSMAALAQLGITSAGITGLFEASSKAIVRHTRTWKTRRATRGLKALPESPLYVLQMRLSKGEINLDTFNQLKQAV